MSTTLSQTAGNGRAGRAARARWSARGQVHGHRNLPVDRQVSRPASGDGRAGRRAPAPPAGGFRHGETRRAEPVRERGRGLVGTGADRMHGRAANTGGAAGSVSASARLSTGGGHKRRSRSSAAYRRSPYACVAASCGRCAECAEEEEGRLAEGGGSVEHVGAAAVGAQDPDRNPVAAGARGLRLDAAPVWIVAADCDAAPRSSCSFHDGTGTVPPGHRGRQCGL